MEEEQRKKKLEAGKERLAAFRKKKAKKKKKSTNGEESPGQLHGADGNLADASSCSDAQSLTGDSDPGSLGSYTSGDEWSTEESEVQHSAVFYQTRLLDASRRMAELEEMVEGKQLALDKVIQENRQLRDQKPEGDLDANREDKQRNTADPAVKQTDLHAALAQRDQIIQQLTARLRASSETPDYTQETQTLAQQVALLQQQLQQAGETLHGQLDQHNVSAAALQDARAEILALQALVQEKETTLQQLTLQASSRNQEILALQALVQEKETILQQLALKANNSQEILELQALVEEKERTLQQFTEQAGNSHEVLELQVLVQEKETTLQQLSLQADSSKQEILELQALCTQKEEELASTVQQYQVRIQELETSVSKSEALVLDLQTDVEKYELKEKDLQTLVVKYESREKDLQTVVEKYELREKEFVQCIQQHEARQQELEVYVTQCASNETTLRQTIVNLEGQLTNLAKEKDILVSSLDNSGQSDQQQIAKLTLELQNLGAENEKMMSEFEKVRVRNNELEVLCKEVEDECSLKQSENDELKNRINDQQGETLALKARLEDMATEGADSLVSQLQRDIERLQGERDSYSGAVESLNSKVLDLQLQLSDSKAEADTYRAQTEVLQSQLERSQLERTRLDTGSTGLVVDGSDALASELEVRTVDSEPSKTLQLDESKTFSATLSSEDSKMLHKELVQVESVAFVGSAVSVGDSSDTKAGDYVADSELVSDNRSVEQLQERVMSLTNEISMVQNELQLSQDKVTVSATKLDAVETQNQIFMNQCQESSSVIQSLSSELQTTCDKLKQSKRDYEELSKTLEDHIKDNSVVSAKLDQMNSEVSELQATLMGKASEVAELQQELIKVRQKSSQESHAKDTEDSRSADCAQCRQYVADLDQLKKDLSTSKESQAKDTVDSSSAACAQCRQYVAEVDQLKKDLAQAQAGLAEVALGGERAQEDLQNQCDQYASEAAELQQELTNMRTALEETKHQIKLFEERCQILIDEKEAEKERVTFKDEEIRKYGELTQKLEQDLESTKEELKNEQEKSQSLQTDNAQVVEKLSGYEDTSDKYLAEIKDLKSKLDTLSTDHSKTLTVVEEERAQLVDQIKLDLKESESQREILSEEVTDTQQQLMSSTAETKHLHSQLHCKSKEVKQLREKSASNEETISDLTDQLQRRQQQQENTQQLLDQTQQQQDKTQQQLEETQQQHEETKQQQEKTQQQLEETQQQQEKTKQQLEQKTDQLEETKQQLEETKEQFKSEQQTWNEALRDKENEMLQMKTDLDNIQQIKQSVEATDEESQRQLMKLQDEVLRSQKEIEELMEKQIIAEEKAEKDKIRLEELQVTLSNKEEEFTQTTTRLEQSEHSQNELQTEYTNQSTQITNLLCEKEELENSMKESKDIHEREMSSLQSKVQQLETEVRQLKEEHASSLEEERGVKSEVSSQLDVVSAEVTHLQEALDKANKDVVNAESEMDKLRSEYEVQLQEYISNTEALKLEVRSLQTETEQTNLTLLSEKEENLAVQSQYEASLKQIERLNVQLQANIEEIETAKKKKIELAERIMIEEASRAEEQALFDSLKSEFNIVNRHVKNLRKDINNYSEQIRVMIQQTDMNCNESSPVTLDQGLHALEQSLADIKEVLQERMAQFNIVTQQKEELEVLNATLIDSEQSLRSEAEKLNIELEEMKNELTSSSAEKQTLEGRISSLQEEKEVLKANFDSCMEDMQQKLSEQENQSRSLQSQLMETAKKKDMDNDQTQTLYEDLIRQLEEKIAKLESDLGDARKDASEYREKSASDQNSYENKIVDMEEKVGLLESENSRLHVQLSNFTETVAQEKDNIKVLFESQISELEENCKSLEVTVSRLQEQMTETSKTYEQEKQEVEQTYELQLSEVEDKCRVLELSNGKLRRQMEEMSRDFQTEKDDLHKFYETQLVDLEDRCSQSELTANKSMQHVTDISKDFGDEKDLFESTIHELQQRCYQLEKSRDDVQERLELVSNSAHQERKNIQESLSKQITETQQKYSVLETEYSVLKDLLNEREQTHREELPRLETEHLAQLTALKQQHLQSEEQTQGKSHRGEQALSQQKDELEKALKCQQKETEQLRSELEKEITMLQNECKTLTNQLSLAKNEESIKNSASSASDVEQLKRELDSSKTEVKTLSCQIEELEMNLVIEREHVKEAIEKFDELDAKYQKEMQGLTEHASGESKTTRNLKDKIKSLNSQVTVSSQELSKEKQRCKAAKLALEKAKKELQKQKLESDEEIETLKTRLEAWEVELIQRRQFLEEESAATKQRAELETLVKNYEQKIENLTDELSHLKTEYPADQGREVTVIEGTYSKPDQQQTGVFEPEPDTPTSLKTSPEFLTHSSFHSETPVVQGFQPEVDTEGFMIFEGDTSETDKNHSVQVESHTSVGAESVTSGDGFQPELDDARADTFQPEEAGEFKLEVDDAVEQTRVPHLHTKIRSISVGMQTEVSSLTPETLSEEGQSLTAEIESIRNQLTHEKEVLEEQYVQKIKKLEVDLKFDHQTAMAEYKKEVDKQMQKKLAAMKDEKHQAFIKALRKARRQLEERHKREVEKLKHDMARTEKEPSPELLESDLVRQLHKDNQELAEARDALLKEIDRTQQDESISIEKAEDKDGSESSDRRQSERFMEELESLSQRSGSELPLEWELTLSSDDGVFDRELDDEGLCTRAECLEMKRQYHRLVGLYQHAQGDSVFIEEVSPNRVNVEEERPIPDSLEQEGDTPESSHHRAETDVIEHGEGEYFEESFRDKIQKLESDNIALEKKLCDQLEMFTYEKQQLKQKCEQLQVNLNSTATNRQSVEERIIKQDEMLQSSLSRLKTEFTEEDEKEASSSHVDVSTSSRGTTSVETQTDLSGDSFTEGLFAQSPERISSQMTKALNQTIDSSTGNSELLSRKDARCAGISSTPFSERKNVRTELNFGEPGISVVERSLSSGASSPTDSIYLPSIDHVEHVMFSDSADSSRVQSPTGRTPIRRKKREQPIEISFNTKSLVSMKYTEGGTIVNKEQIELTGTVDSAGSIVPEDYAKVALEVHHAEMVEEITKLKKELHDAKAKYGQENAMLKEQLERENIARMLWLEKKVPDDRVLRELPLATDVVELRQEVAVLKETNKMVQDENKQLVEQLHDKECLMLHFRDKFGSQSVDSLEECSHGTDTQLLMLQKQRDQLVEEIQDFHEEHERLLSVLDARTAMEDTLRREKEILLEKLVQFEEAQSRTTGKHTELEYLRGEQRRLEQLLLMKDESEKQLLKQKRRMEEEMYDIEGKLKERESFLEEEKHRLLREVKEKNLTILKLETLTSKSSDKSVGAATPGPRTAAEHGSVEGVGLDTSYDEAIEILRNKLRLEYELKEAELNEQHASQQAQFWQQHNKKLEGVRVQHETEMASLQAQLDAERDRGSRHELQLQEQHKQNVAQLRGELGTEKAAMFDTVLREIEDLTHSQIQQAKHDNRNEMQLQLAAMKVAMEQVHTGQLKMVQADMQAQHAAELTHLRTALNSQGQDQVDAGQAQVGSRELVDSKLTERYEQLVQRINEQLDHVLPGLEAPPSGESGEDNSAEALRQLLESQKGEINQLRSEMLGEYERMLAVRADTVRSEAVEVEQLQQQIESLQSQYQQQLQALQQRLSTSTESEQKNLTQEQQTKELEELRTYYEKHVHDMEKTFSDEIADMRTKYEIKISELVSSNDVKDSESLSESRDSVELAKEREYVQRTTRLTVISDSDESSATDSPRGANSAVSRLTDMEKRIQEKEAEISDLKHQLQVERSKSDVSAEEVKSLKDQLNECEKKISDLNNLLTEKESVILDLNNVVLEKVQLISELESDREKEDEEKPPVEESSLEKSSLEEAIEDKTTGEEAHEEVEEKEVVSGDSSSTDLAQATAQEELLGRLEDLEHRHREELESLRHELEHDQQVEVETLQSEFRVQLDIELKRQAAELLKTHEENVKNLMHVQNVEPSVQEDISHSETQTEVPQNITSHSETQTEDKSPVDGLVKQSVNVSLGATSVKDDVDSTVDEVGSSVKEVDSSVKDMDKSESDVDTKECKAGVRSDYEARISALSAEVERLQDEKTEQNKKLQQDLDNLKALLQETEEKYDKLLAETESGEPRAGGELEELFREKYDQQLDLTKQLMQQEFTETLESERHRFVERHRKMMDNFMADRSAEAEEMKISHQAELQALRNQLQELQVKGGNSGDSKEEGGNSEDEEKGDNSRDNKGDNSRDAYKDKTQDKETSEIQGAEVKILADTHKAELEQLTHTWEKKIEELKEVHADELSAAALDTETVKSELETAHQRELSELESRLTQTHQAETERLETELRTMEERLTQKHQLHIEQLNTQHQEALDKLKEELAALEEESRHREPMREVSELVLHTQTTPLLSAADLDSTQESESEAEFLMKSTPRDTPTQAGERRGSTPDEMLTTRSFAEVVRGAPSIVSQEELEEKEEKIEQLEDEIKRLRDQLTEGEADRTLSDTKDSVDRQQGEGESNLVTMLRSDLDRISAERDAVQTANDRLLQILSDSVKSYVSVEDIINKNLARLVNQSQSRPSSGTPREDRSGLEADARRESRGGGAELGARAASPRNDANTSQDSMALEETSILSCNTDEGLDLSQRLTESIFTGPDLDPEGEEILTDARGRLQTSVQHLLEMIEKTTQQLLEAKRTQQELVESLGSRGAESEVLEARCTDLDERLAQEVSAKEYLAIELHKAEGLISGYSTERLSLEQKIDGLEEQRQALALELETSRTQLHEFRSGAEEMQSRQDSLDRQQQLLHENVGQETQALLQEVNALTSQRREVERQSQHQVELSAARVSELEALMEDLERQHEQALEERRVEVEDLRLQLDSLERQLKASKQFLTEQSGEREQEREEYQREVEKLQQLLHHNTKKQSAEGRLQRKVEDLSEELADRIASAGEQDEETRRLQQVLQDKEMSAAELRHWVAHLEQEVEDKTAAEADLRQKLERLEQKLSLRPVGEELSDSSLNSTAEQPTVNPDMMSPDRRSPMRRQLTLEEELEKTKKTREELSLERDALQQQVQEQLLQISALKNQLDDMRHYGGEAPTATHASELRHRLAVERESLEMKEEQVSSLQEQQERLQAELKEREEEVQRLRSELSEVDTQLPDSHSMVQQQNVNLKAEVEKLLGHQEDSADVGMPRFAQDLLDEKNHEIDELNEQISELQMALEATSVMDDSVREHDEVEQLRDELRLKSETIQELQDKMAASASVARGGQFFGDMSLTDADRSLLETSFSEKTNFQQELEETIAQKEEEVCDLRKELETSQLQLTEVESEKVSLKSSLEEQVNELKQALKTAEAKLSTLAGESQTQTLPATSESAEDGSTQTQIQDGSESSETGETSTQTEARPQAVVGVNTDDIKPAEEQENLNEILIKLQDAEQKYSKEVEKVQELQKKLEESNTSATARQEKDVDSEESVADVRNLLQQEREHVQQLEHKLLEADRDISDLKLKVSEAEQLKLKVQEADELKLKLQEADELKLKLQEAGELEQELQTARERLHEREDECNLLRTHLGEREAELHQAQDERDLKQLTLEQVNVQIDSFQDEIKSLTTFQNELQNDFDTVQAMLEEKEKEIENLTRELTECRVPPEGASQELQDKYEVELARLKRVLQEKENIVEEREEELYVLNEKLELQDSLGAELSTVRQQLADTEVTLDEERLARQETETDLQHLKEKLRAVSSDSAAPERVEDHSVTFTQLEEQLAQKEEKLDSVRAEVDELKERLSEQQRELNQAQDKLQEQESWKERVGDKDALVAQLQARVADLEEELQKFNTQHAGDTGQDTAAKVKETVEEEQITMTFVDDVEGVHSKSSEDVADVSPDTVNQLKERIRHLEQELEQKDHQKPESDPQERQDDIQKQLAEKNDQYDKLLTDKILLEKSVIELELKLEEKMESLEQMDSEKNELSEKEEQIAKLQEELRKARSAETQGSVNTEIERLEQSLELKRQEVESLEATCEDLRQQLNSSPSTNLNQIQDLQQQLADREQHILELEGRYEDLKQQMREEAGRLEEEIQKIHAIQESQPDPAQVEEAHKRAMLAAAELDKAREKLHATETTLEQTLVQLAERDEQIKALFSKKPHELQGETVGDALEETQQEVYALSLEVREKEEDIERLQADLTSLEDQLDDRTNQLQDTQDQLHTARDHLQRQAAQLQESQDCLKQARSEVKEAHQVSLSASLPLELGDSENQLMIRSESEPALNNWRRESTLFKSRLHEVESLARQQKQELTTKNQELAVVRKQLEQWLSQERGEGDAGTIVANLQQELQERERNIQLLQTEIDELTETVLQRDIQLRQLHTSAASPPSSHSAREATPPESEQQIRQLKLELRKAKSALAEIHHSGDFLDRTPEGSATEDDQSPVRLGDEARNLRREVHQLREELELYRTSASMSSRDFVKKVMELRQELSEEHKNHIRDVQERLKIDSESQLTTLQLRHDDEMKTVRRQHADKMQTALGEQRQELEKQHKQQINSLILEHRHQIDLLREEVRDDGSVTDLRNALIQDIQTTQQMDNRLIEHLQRPPGEGGEDSDTASTPDTSSVETAAPGIITHKLQGLLSRVHKKGVHVLSLSELQFLQRHMTQEHLQSPGDVEALRQAWERERETLLSTINSLKDLLTRVHRTTSSDRTEEHEDWRAELVCAVCDVFDREREALLAELRSYVVSSLGTDKMAVSLQQRISDQESLHRTAVDELQSADRKSLLTEMTALRKKASTSRQQTEESQQTYLERISSLEDQSAKQQRQQQRQIQVLEYKLQQERVIQEDLKTSLDLERTRLRDISAELSREKNAQMESHAQLSTLQIQLSKARDALEREHNRYKSVTDALEEERGKNSRLADLLEVERRKCALLDSQVLDLRSHNKDYLEKESKFVEQLRVELEREREKRLEVSRQVEQERGARQGAREDLEEERRRSKLLQSDADALLAQLKLSLQAERTKQEELSRKLDEERETMSQVQSSLEQERRQHQESTAQSRGAVEDLEARLRAGQTQMEELQRALARERHKLNSVSEMLDTERENMRQSLEHERAVCRQLKRESQEIQTERSDLKRQLQMERETVKTYQNQTEQLRDEVKLLKQRENENLKRSDSHQGAARKTIREMERDRDQLNIRVHELELEQDRLRDKLQDSQLQLDSVQNREMQVRHEMEALRLNTASQLKSQARVRTSASVEAVASDQTSVRTDGLDNCIQRLEFLALRMQDETGRLPGDQRGVDYLSELRAVLLDMKQASHTTHQVQGSSSAGQLANERIIKHNDELTAFLERVCREKQDLQATVDSLEEELNKHRSQSRQVGVVTLAENEGEEDRYMQDRMAWAGERLSLQMELDTAQYEVERLQAEVRLLRSQTNSEGYLTEADREKMQRLYGKFLRAESFRKALVYQKRYLLLLLGGYQDCEQETLMLIAQMGGYPSDIDVQRRRRHTRYFSLFRSAARVVIAIARMKYMVRKWRRAIRVGSPVVSGRVNISLGYMPSSSAYTSPQPAQSPRHFPSLSRVPDVPISSASEPLLVLNGDLTHTYPVSNSAPGRPRQFTTPPTKDPSASPRVHDRALTSSARRRVLQDGGSVALSLGRTRSLQREAHADESTDDFLHRLENLQTRLGTYDTGVSSTRQNMWR